MNPSTPRHVKAEALVALLRATILVRRCQSAFSTVAAEWGPKWVWNHRQISPQHWSVVASMATRSLDTLPMLSNGIIDAQ